MLPSPCKPFGRGSEAELSHENSRQFFVDTLSRQAVELNCQLRQISLIHTLAAPAAQAGAAGAEQGGGRRDRREARLAWAAHPRVWAEREDYQAALPAKALVDR